MNDTPPAPLFSTNGGDVAARVDGLAAAVDAASGRLDPGLVNEGATVVRRAADRLRLASDRTVVALAGATGSGKSSLFNAVAGIELSAVGVRRPTTSWAMAVAWGESGSRDLLEWMGIPERQQMSLTSPLGTVPDDTNLDGLVLLDLPDHDSTEVSHHLEVDRLVQYADVLVWVLDPQKYADAAIHDRYLRPLARHAGVTMVVLNQIDRLPPEKWDGTLQDVRRLLADDGLAGVPLIAVSALRGDGVDDFKRALVRKIRDKQAAGMRTGADVEHIAKAFEQMSGDVPAIGLTDSDRDQLVATLAEAAGVSAVADSAEKALVSRAVTATTWPPLRFVGRSKRPSAAEGGALRSLEFDDVSARVQRPAVDVAVRDVAEKATIGLTPPWVQSVRRAVVVPNRDLADVLDHAMSRTGLGLDRAPTWWSVVKTVQWTALAVTVAGLLWLLALVGAEVTGDAAAPMIGGVWLPVYLSVGGLVIGLVLAMVATVAAKSSASRRAQEIDEALRATIVDVASERVLAPVDNELAAYDQVRRGIATALGRRI
ncbi:50S ribosome-binding GTPase [Mumia sp. zg.B53]|uniref:GTPase n=1 Tax=unclassified Mumia TaxID=2621872 RepID=UPI001C6EE7A3|nr:MULTISPECIES: GTPase [unclassified Mumia]MBW9216241.1 50S ribosome-binding GTPase [Mumia sp. zg.B53]MDD9348751.1 50S ribosome-binding GTPase [Mumia sp.]